MKKIITFLSLLVPVVFLTNAVWANDAPLKTYTTTNSYEDVVQDMKDAITDAGLKIDFGGKISEMLERTGKDIGATMKVYKNAEFMQFCSASLTRKMMEADPANIVFCPYVIFYYERTDEPGTVYVGYRELDEEGSDASEAAKKTINKLLGEIIKEAERVN